MLFRSYIGGIDEVVRFFDATIIFISIAAGVGFVLEFWFRVGGRL